MSKKNKHLFIRPISPVRVQQKFVPEDSSLRTGTQDPKYIVIHEVSLRNWKIT